MVLGHTGLLGNCVASFLQKYYNVITLDTSIRFPSTEFRKAIADTNTDYIVNCIGSIHQRSNLFNINFELPMWLDSLGIKIIHPGTDCEIDTDLYGISKKIARDYIVNFGKNTKIIKTSVIGMELNSSYSLLNWLLSQSNGTTINGFINQYWNGNTTLTWAETCLDLILDWNVSETETILCSDCISKYELLTIMAKVFEKDVKIVPTKSVAKDKCLVGTYMGCIENQLYHLKSFYNK